MSNTKILIVEDESIIAINLKRQLEKLNYEVVGTAHNGKEAIDLASKTNPNLILMDIKMPGEMDGIEAAEIIMKENKIPLVYLTAYTDDETIKRAKNTEPFAYLIKPYDIAELESTIQISLYRNKIETQLKLSEEKYRLLVENQTEIIIKMDTDKNCLFVSPSFCSMYGKTESEMIGNKYSPFVDESEIAKISLEYDKVFSEPYRNQFEYYEKTVSGWKWFAWSASAIFDENKKVSEIIAVGRDITKRKDAELALKVSEEQLRKLSLHLQTVREEERKKISLEIHDDLGQKLTALKIDLSWLKKNISPINDKTVEKIKMMDELINDSIRSMQKISTELRPSLLDDLGLVSAIEWQMDDFQKRTNINCNYNLIDDDIKIPQEVSVNIYRIIQEALTNVVRHSEASTVNINLVVIGNKLELKIKDNGKGMPDELFQNPNSIGLTGMRERTHSCEGSFDIHSEIGSGTEIIITFPFNG